MYYRSMPAQGIWYTVSALNTFTKPTSGAAALVGLLVRYVLYAFCAFQQNDIDSFYQSRLRFAPRRISHQMSPLASPVKSLLGTNPCRSYVNISLVQQMLKELELHAENFEDHLFLLGLVLRQLSKERWFLGNHIGLHRSLLVTFEKRLDSMIQAPPDPAWPPCNVQITDITFEFHTDSGLQVCSLVSSFCLWVLKV